MKKLLASLLTTVLMLSVFAVPSMADYPDELKYYVNETDYFIYSICRYEQERYHGEEHELQYELGLKPEDKALFIYGASENFKTSVSELIIPDEINGEKIENVIVRDYTFLNKVVLSDGIKNFICYTQIYGDSGVRNKRNANPLKSLHLGRDFELDGLAGTKSYSGRLENLETVTVSEENPCLNIHNGAVYTEDYKTLVYCPPNLKVENFYLHENTKTISYCAFRDNRYIKNIKNFKQIKTIEHYAFQNSKSIEKLAFGNNIKVIPSGAFYNSNIKQIENTKNIEKIEYAAFEKSKIEKFVVGNKVKTIGESVFKKSGIKEIKLGKNVEKIESEAFDNTTNLKKVVIGKKIKKIDHSAFYKSNVEQIVVGGDVKLGSAFIRSKLKKVTFKGDVTIPKDTFPFSRCKHIDFYTQSQKTAKYLVQHLKSNISKYNIKSYKIFIGKKLYSSGKTKLDKLVIDNVKRINNNKYRAANAKELVAGGKVKTIGYTAFRDSEIEKATIEESVETIESAAFGSKLKEITINGEVRLQNGALSCSNLKKVTVNGRLKISKNARPFSGCKNISFYAKSEAVAKYLKDFFSKKPLSKHDIKGGKIYLGNKLYYSFKNKIKKLEIKNVERIKSWEYQEVNAKELVVGSKVKKIDVRAFWVSNIEKATIGKNVKTINDEAFYGSKLKEITINGTTKLGNEVFRYTKLEKVTVNAKIKIEKGTMPFYRMGHVDFYAKNESVAKHIKELFSRPLDKRDLKSLNIYIGKKLFCSMETKVDKMVIDDVEEIAACEYQCVDAEELVIGSKVKNIGFCAFESSNIKKATIGENVEIIEEGAFSGAKLKELVINGNTIIGSNAFSCDSLKKVTINGQIDILAEYSPFVGCGNIEFYAKNKEIADDLYSQLIELDFENGKIFVGNELLYSITPEK